MKTFIRIAEVWAPAEDGRSLELSSGLFPEAPAFEAITRQMVFAKGEGLPGRAWEKGHPLMMRELVGSYFKRAAAARAIDLTCAVACPVFQGQQLRCVVVLLMGGAPSTMGSVELWRNDSRLSSDMTLVDGYFGTSERAEELEALTREGWLPRGAGAPGLAWQKEETICIPDIASSKHFLRTEAALALGIGRALATPCTVRGNSTWVLGLLSAPVAPIALRVEVWRGHETQPGTLFRTAGFCESIGVLPCGDGQARPIEALGPIGETWLSAVAQADGQLPDWNTPIDLQTLRGAGITSVLTLPVVVDDVVHEVVALYF
jgi:hypothetical protein